MAKAKICRKCNESQEHFNYKYWAEGVYIIESGKYEDSDGSLGDKFVCECGEIYRGDEEIKALKDA
jgi:hypothetical protein|tara:strand:+ start:365 stop:562 length:198 start_codon:yes stop_codon:yes gene_type:complete